VADKTGSTAFGAGVNVNFAGGPFSDQEEFNKLNSSGDYVTAQLSASRDQRIYEDWSMLIKADGQWAVAQHGLISNEQFGIGGTAGVRGYQEGERYGSSGWRATVEPRTPMVDIGMVDGTAPMRVRASVFMDYGQSYLYEVPVGVATTEQLWGAGLGFSGTIGTSFDFRFAAAWALHSASMSKPGDLQIYFGLGAQF
jgi:hemolysin activation/secretion protein